MSERRHYKLFVIDLVIDSGHVFFCRLCNAREFASRYLFVQSQRWKHQSNIRSMFKVNNKDTSKVNIVDFEQVNMGWVQAFGRLKKKNAAIVDIRKKYSI